MDHEIYDLCIIGAGMFGAAAARHASSDSSVKVCLIGPNEPKDTERETRDVWGAHYDEGRSVYIVNPNPVMQVLARHTIKRFQEIEKLSGVDFFSPIGTIVTAERGTNYLYTLLQGLEMHKVQYIDLSENDVMKQRFPYLKLDPRDYPLLDDDGAGYIKARAMVAAQKKVAALQGCCMVEEVVEEVREFKDGAHKVITEKGSVIRARQVLLCTGAFTGFKKLTNGMKLKFHLNKETVAMLRIPEEEKDRLSSMPTFSMSRDGLMDLSVATGAYILPPIQHPDGYWYLKIGIDGTQSNPEISLEEIKKWYNSSGCQETIDNCSKFLMGIISGLKVEEVTGKTCITCHSPSGLPYINQISPTVTVAVVGNGCGAMICDEVGRIASELSLTGKWNSELPQKSFEANFD